MRPLPGSPDHSARPALCIDVSNTIETPSVSGVQRVTLGLGRALAELVPVQLLDGRSGQFVRAHRSARRRLRRLEQGRNGRGLASRLESRAVRLGGTAGRSFSLDESTVLLDIEASWHAPLQRNDLLPRLTGVPTAALLHDLLPLTNPEWFRPEVTERFGHWFRAHIEAGSTLLAVSEATADAAVTVVPEVTRPSVIRLGHPPKPSISAGSGLLMVGTIEPRKGHSVVLDALDLLGDQAPVVDVVGRPGWADQELVQRLRGHGKVRWHEAASDAVVDELWSLSGVLLQPSAGEGYGLPVVEALQRNVAVLASDIPALREVSRGEATHLDLDPAAWAEAIRRFARTPDDWPRPDRLEWPTWRDSALDLLTALTHAGVWPEAASVSK